VGAELFHTGGRTDRQTDGQNEGPMTKLIVAFRNFSNTRLKTEVLKVVHVFPGPDNYKTVTAVLLEG
jgi:hypothetical protein